VKLHFGYLSTSETNFLTKGKEGDERIANTDHPVGGIKVNEPIKVTLREMCVYKKEQGRLAGLQTREDEKNDKRSGQTSYPEEFQDVGGGVYTEPRMPIKFFIGPGNNDQSLNSVCEP